MPRNSRTTKNPPQRKFVMMVLVLCFLTDVILYFKFPSASSYKVESTDHLSRLTSLLWWRRALVRSWTRPWRDPGCSSRCWRRGRCRWRTGLRAVSTTTVGISCPSKLSTPDDHFATCPNCRMVSSWIRGVRGARYGPAICAGLVSASSVQTIEPLKSTPHDHFAITPNCRIRRAAIRRIGSACGSPAISARIVSRASVDIVK